MAKAVEANQPTPQEACYCFLNTAAGSKTAGAYHTELAALFESLGSAVQLVTPKAGEVEAAVRRALGSGCKRIIAAGGDGTVHAVANVLAGTDAALAVLPLGTLNHFARDLGIPVDIEQAVRVSIAGTVRSVDVGEVNGRVFVNNSSIGFYPHVVRQREALQRRGGSKWLALMRALLGVFRRSRALQLSMTYNGHNMTARSEFVFVGNNEYQFSAQRLAARPHLDGGQLWVWHVPHAGRFRAIAAAAAALLGKNSKSPLTFTTGELVLKARASRILVAMDGEALELTMPLTYRVLPAALRVIVPRENST